MSREVRFRERVLSHVGRVRERNEDRCCARADIGLWAVADGMGGHARGDWASAQVCEALSGLEPAESIEAAERAVRAALALAHGRIRQEAAHGAGTIGTTVVVLIIQDGRYVLLWAGDSRAYRLRGATLARLSRDHTQVQEMQDGGLISEEEARRHPFGHVLTRGLGGWPVLDLACATGSVIAGDRFLLCSDGLTAVVTDDEIATMLDDPDRLLDLCLDRGAPDNVTLVTVRVGAAQ